MFPLEVMNVMITQLVQSQTTQRALVEDAQINVLVSEAATMQQDIEEAAARCISLEWYLTSLQAESESLLREDATPAMDSLIVLIDCIESVHQVTQAQRMPAWITYHDDFISGLEMMQVRMALVNECKSQSRIVFGHFQSLSEKARNLTQKFADLATDFTFETAVAQERIEKLQNIVQVAASLRDGVERQRESWHGLRTTAEAHVQEARETVRSAERNRDSRESARVVRNILTLGIGEVFDFFDLNEEIRDAERTVANAEQHATACRQSIQQAMAALQQIEDEVGRLNVFESTVYVQETMLQESVTHGQALRTRTIDLTNASMNISLFVGKLAARSETFSIHHTAQEFAQSVLDFGRLMASDGMLNRLLIQYDPESLEETLDMIAQSDDEDDIPGDHLITGPQEPRFAIDELM